VEVIFEKSLVLSQLYCWIILFHLKVLRVTLHKIDRSRPNTVSTTNFTKSRSRIELFNQRKESFIKAVIPLETAKVTRNDGEIQIISETIPAGRRPISRDARDRVTIRDDLENGREQAIINYMNEVNGYTEKYSTLTALKQGRLMAERRDTQRKTDEMINRRSMAQLHEVQLHKDLAMKKHKPEIHSSKSHANFKEVENDPRALSLKYVENPEVKTQNKLFLKRKQNFLKDMRK
jgi:hypothetical protein